MVCRMSFVIVQPALLSSIFFFIAGGVSCSLYATAESRSSRTCPYFHPQAFGVPWTQGWCFEPFRQAAHICKCQRLISGPKDSTGILRIFKVVNTSGAIFRHWFLVVTFLVASTKMENEVELSSRAIRRRPVL